MVNLLGLSDYPRDVLALIAAAVIIGGAFVGVMTDAVMGDRGFGAWGNGILAVLGAVVGMYIRSVYFMPVYGYDLMVSGLAAAGAATAMLLILGVAKHFVER